MMKKKSIHILLPVLNEERRIAKGLDTLLPFMRKHFENRYFITIVDNGSSDKTGEIARLYLSDNLRYIQLAERGVGLAFRTGCASNTADIIGYIDIDLSTDISHLLDVDRLFEDPAVDIVNASRLSKDSRPLNRKWYRSITSLGLKCLLKIFFGMKIDDAICGFKFFRKDVVNRLITKSSDTPGWFYCIELLIRAEKAGYIIKEIPVIWRDNHDTRVKTFSLIFNYLKQIVMLRITLNKEKKHELS
jgi:glycosyltransferase involved in cell wall biosynthesis